MFRSSKPRKGHGGAPMRFLFFAVSAAALLAFAVGSVQSVPGVATSPSVRETGLRPAWGVPPLAPGAPAARVGSARAARIAAQGDHEVEILVRLPGPSLASLPRDSEPSLRIERAAAIRRGQDLVVTELMKLGAKPGARLRNVLNGIVVTMPARLAPEIEALPGVETIHPIRDYELHLGQTIPYIGANQLHQSGIDGQGVRIGILDSGTDYTHLDLGGSGDPADFYDAYFGDAGCVTGREQVCSNRSIDDGLFPNNKVVGGYDFVGDPWPDGSREPDPDPIDSAWGSGHGTHVADIAAGLSGVAPGAELLALKVCSTGGSCSGAAILEALDFALDPDGDPGTDDAADVLNASWGSPYGQREDAVWYAMEQAVHQGVVVVASAGTQGDRPFIVASPASAPGVIAVGAVQYPTQMQSVLFAAGVPLNVVHQGWSGDYQNASGGIFYGATPETRYACLVEGNNPFSQDSLVGTIAVVERGGCRFSEKAANVEDAGGHAVVLLEAVAQSEYELPGYTTWGGETVTIPAFTATTSDSAFLRQVGPTTAFVDPASDTSLEGYMVGSSSRGPAAGNGLKPDILAPGAAISAHPGTGVDLSYFSGTSGSAPHVSGSAALLLQANPDWAPPQIKATLMNSADPDVSARGGVTAPVALAGAGIVDVWNSFLVGGEILAVVEESLQAAGGSAIGYQTFTMTHTITDALELSNFTQDTVTPTVDVVYKDPDQGGVTVSVTSPAPISGGASGTVEITYDLDTDLQDWTLDRGAGGFDGCAFAAQEIDGYFLVNASGMDIRVPFHGLPKKVGDLGGLYLPEAGPGVLSNIVVSNGAPTPGPAELFHLYDHSPNDFDFTVGDCTTIGLAPGCDQSPIDLRGVGVRDRLVDLDSDGSAEQWLEFGATVWDRPYRDSQYPVQIGVYLDTDQDGVTDIIVFTAPVTIAGILDGRNAVWVYDVGTGETEFGAWTDSTFNSQNWIVPVEAATVGLAVGDTYDWYLTAWDIYRDPAVLWDCSPAPAGQEPCGTDAFTTTLGEPRFGAGEGNYTVPITDTTPVTYTVTSTLTSGQASPSEVGFMMMYRLALVGKESQFFQLVMPGVDDDGDGADNGQDCDVNDPTAFDVPPEVTNLRFGPSDASTQLVLWDPVNDVSGAGTTYNVYVESNGFGAVGNDPNGGYVLEALTDPLANLTGPLTPGEVQRILVDGVNACGTGPLHTPGGGKLKP